MKKTNLNTIIADNLNKTAHVPNKGMSGLPNKKATVPFVSNEGYKNGLPPVGSHYRIPSDTLYNPTPYRIKATPNNGPSKWLEAYDTSNTQFPGADYVNEQHFEYGDWTKKYATGGQPEKICYDKNGYRIPCVDKTVPIKYTFNKNDLNFKKYTKIKDTEKQYISAINKVIKLFDDNNGVLSEKQFYDHTVKNLDDYSSNDFINNVEKYGVNVPNTKYIGLINEKKGVTEYEDGVDFPVDVEYRYMDPPLLQSSRPQFNPQIKELQQRSINLPTTIQQRFPKGDYNYIFGPANSVIGRNYNGQFYSEDMPNQRGKVNQPDLDLLNNPEALKKYVQNKGLKFENGGSLPKAQKGGWWKKLTSTLNPYNWGVEDYSKEKDFIKAYSTAKKAGEEEFMYKGKRYNTKYAGTPRQEVGTYGVDGKPVHPIDLNHPTQANLYPLFGQYFPGHISAQVLQKAIPSINYDSDGNNRYGIGSATEKGEKSYYSYGVDTNKFYDVATKLPGKMTESDILRGGEPSTWNLFTNNCADNVCDAFGIPRIIGIQTPSNAVKKIKQKYPTLDVTGRTYYDYENLYEELQNQPNKKILSQSKNILGIASSPDLQESGLSKSFIGTIQGVLADEGYNLSKSLRKKGNYDGVYGPETKQALADWQSKNKNKSLAIGGSLDWMGYGGIPVTQTTTKYPRQEALAQKGKIVVTNPNHPRLRAYQDSLTLHKYWDTFNKVTNKIWKNKTFDEAKDSDLKGKLPAYPISAMNRLYAMNKIYPYQKEGKMSGQRYFPAPVEPVVYQKPKPELLKSDRTAFTPGLVGQQRPDVQLPTIQNLPYRVEYYDGDINGMTHKNFIDEKAGSEFMKELQNRSYGIPYGVQAYYENTLFEDGGSLPKAQNGFGCTGKSKCITGSDQKKKDGISGGYIGGMDNIVPLSNAPINYDELTKYVDDQYTDRSSKKQRQAEYAQAAQLYPGLTKNDFYASQAEASRLNSRINDISTWDKPENQTYDRAWYPYYRSIIQPGVKVNSSQILKFISGQPGGIGGYRQTVESNYGLKKNKYGGWLEKYQGGGEEPLTKSSADWYKQWYEQRKTLPQFSRVAGERLNLLSTLPKVQLTPLEKLYKSRAVAQYQKTRGDDASQDIISLADPATVPAFGEKIGKSIDVNIGTDPSVVGHEMSHWFDARAKQSIFKPRGISKSEPYQKYPYIKPSSFKKSGLSSEDYKWISSDDNPEVAAGVKTELNSVLNELREKEGFRGDQPTTPEQLQKIIDKYMNLPESELDGGKPKGSQNQRIRTLIKYMGGDPEKLSELNNRIVAIQKEDVPIAMHGGWLSKYDEGGPKKNTLKQAAEKGKQFNKDWMNSPMYKQMFETSMGANNFYDINKIAANHMAINRKYQLENSQWGVGPKHPNSSERTAAEAYTWKPWGIPLAGSPINYLSNYSKYPDAIPYVNFVKGAAGQRGDDLNSNAVHEFSHISDASGEAIPESDKDLMAKYAARLGFQNSLVFEKPFSRKKFVDKEKEWYDYVRDPSETRARLTDFRMRAKDQGLYDPFTQKFDIKYLKNYKEIVPLPNKSGYDPLNQLRDIYTDEEISDMLNKVAKSDNVQPQTMAKYGGSSTGWLGKYETGSEVTETTTVKPGWSLMSAVPEWNANGTSTIQKPVVKKVTETPKKLPQKSYVGRPATQEEWENSNNRQVPTIGTYRIPTEAELMYSQKNQKNLYMTANRGRKIAPGWTLGGVEVAVTQPSLTEEQKFQFKNPYITPNPNLNTSVPGTPEYWWSEAGWNPEKQQTPVGMGAFARLYPQFATPDSDREWTTLPDGRSVWKKRVHPWQIPGTPQFKALTEINKLEKEKNWLIGKAAIQLADPTGVTMWNDTWDSYKELYNNPSVWNATLAGVNTVASLPVIRYAGEEFMIPVKAAEATAKVAQITSKLEKLYTKYPQLSNFEKIMNVGKKVVGTGKKGLNYLNNSAAGKLLHYVGGEPFIKTFDKATGAEKLFKLPTTGVIQSFNKMERFGKATVNFPINMYTANQDIKNLKISSKETPEEYFNFKREDGSIFQINAEIQNKHLPGSIPDDAIDPDWNREGVIIPLMTEKKLKDRQIYIPAMYNNSQKTQQKLKKLPNKK